jgi:hypothetical protein
LDIEQQCGIFAKRVYSHISHKKPLIAFVFIPFVASIGIGTYVIYLQEYEWLLIQEYEWLLIIQEYDWLVILIIYILMSITLLYFVVRDISYVSKQQKKLWLIKK